MRLADLVVLEPLPADLVEACQWCQMDYATHLVGDPADATIRLHLCADCPPRPPRVVGWSLQPQPCTHCRKPATRLLASDDGLDYGPVCESCIPPTAIDEIALVVQRAFAAR